MITTTTITTTVTAAVAATTTTITNTTTTHTDTLDKLAGFTKQQTTTAILHYTILTILERPQNLKNLYKNIESAYSFKINHRDNITFRWDWFRQDPD